MLCCFNPWFINFPLQVGHKPGSHSRIRDERLVRTNACNAFKGFNCRQTRSSSTLFMSNLQNKTERTNLCLDIQPKNEKQTNQMDSCWCGVDNASLIYDFG